MGLNVCLTYDFIVTETKKGKIKQSKKLNLFGLILEKLDFSVHYGLKNFSQDEFYKLAHLTKSNNIYEDITLQNLTSESLHYLKNSVINHEYLITYELSTNSREILEYLEIKYIDIWLSPIRFYKDTLFEFYSNDEKIKKELTKLSFDNKKLFKRAKKIKTHCKFFLENPNLEKNSCLIIGQMNQDKSVMKDGKFLTLIDFMDKLQELSTKHNKLYLLKHPLTKNEDFEYIKKKLASIRNLEILINVNTYHLLTMKEITCVAGISSSVLIESEYFNKKVELFYKPVIDNDYVRIYKHFFNSNFWQTIFRIKKKKTFQYFMDNNYFRLHYNLIYAYDIFLPTLPGEKLELKEKYNTIINLYNCIKTIDVSQKYILYGFGSVGKLLYPHLKNNIVAIVDKVVFINLKEYEGIPIISVSELDNYTYDKIIVSPFLHQNEITFELRNYTNQLIHIKV